MRCGILIVGSLLWDQQVHRVQWREARLDMAGAVKTALAIRYGRRSSSRKDTYTMVLSPGDAAGQAIIVPTKAGMESASDLRAEAEALWQAEDKGAKGGILSRSWGAVGTQFLSQEAANILPDA